MSIKNVIIFGAGGFLGQKVAKAFAAEGFRVYGVGRGSFVEHDLHNCGIHEWYEAQISIETLTRYEEFKINFEYAIYCAGGSVVSKAYEQPNLDFKNTLVSLADALEFCRRQQIKLRRFIYISSAAVYGDQGEVVLREDSELAPISPYGVNKLMSELLCKSYSAHFGMNVSIVRLFSVFGIGLKKQLLWDAMNKFKKDEHQFFGTGNEIRDWIYVDDAANLILKAATIPNERIATYNGGNAKASIKDVLDKLATSAGIGQRPIFNNVEHTGNPKFLIADTKLARSELKWMPKISLDEGLGLYSSWFSGGMMR